MSENKKIDDMDEAARLEAASEGLPAGAARDEVLAEAAALRAQWQAPAEIVHLAGVSADLREADLKEAERLDAIAKTLRAGGAGRAAVEAEATALRAKWPEFQDDAEGQVQRLAAYLISHGVPDVLDRVPARVVLERLAALEAELATRPSEAPAFCPGCALPQPGSGPAPVNAYLVAAMKSFETDVQFREQVKSGQVQPGHTTHPWLQGAPPHKGPATGTSPWALGSMGTMIKGDSRLLSEVGPKLRAAFAERGISIPAGAGSQKPRAVATAAILNRSNSN